MVINYLQIEEKRIPVVSTKLDIRDHIGALQVRWMINRNNYRIEPGMSAVGKPDKKSDVFVSANYKLSFDHLRKNLDGLNGWILVLDTKGVNVWCAAGKGTFGTKELVNRIQLTGLDKIVSHRKLIVPQLGATGVSAYQVKDLTSTAVSNSQAASCGCNSFVNAAKVEASSIKINRGFDVIFGPVRASDIKSFIVNGYKTTPEMRRVTFNLSDRIILTSVDVVYARYKLLAAFALIFIVSGLNRSGIDFSLAYNKGFASIANIFLAYITGIVITPILLPYLPVKMFAFKGMITGILLSFVLLYFNKLGNNYFEVSSWFLLISGISSFMAMNFTGASTYTSLSGVKKEMRIAVPVQISFAVVGLVLLVIGKLV
jgi:hypothetical protein